MAHRGKANADELIATALAAGATAAEAATQAKVNPRTVFRRLQDQGFRDRVAELRGQMLSRTLGKLSDGTVEAAEALREMVKEETGAVRLGAAKALIDLTVKVRESVDLEEQVKELEQRINEVENPGGGNA
jgi:hypothetical protein